MSTNQNYAPQGTTHLPKASYARKENLWGLPEGFFSMALIKPILGELKGSIGGNTFQGSRYGQVVRQRTIPVDPATARQAVLRQHMADANVFWKGETSSYRSGWKTYADNTPWTNRFGDEVFLTGRLQFIRSAVFNLAAGEAIPAQPPEFPGLPANPDFSLTCDTTNGLRISDILISPGTADLLGIYTSAPFAETVNFFKGPYVLSDFITTDTAVPFTLIANTGVLVGQKYFVGVRYREPDFDRLAQQVLIKNVVCS